MALTFDLIASQDMGGTTGVTFSSIPGSYSDLRLIVNCGVPGNTVWVRLNGDSGSNYEFTRTYGNGSVNSGSYVSTIYGALLYYGGESYGNGGNSAIVDLYDYKNTTSFKTMFEQSAAGASVVETAATSWKNTSAITSLTIGGATFATGSKAWLYGILRA